MMKIASSLAAILVALSFAASLQTFAAEPPNAEPPNIVILLVDDMGYSDIGCYGGEVLTPNIDRLARDGLRFTSMYNTSKCFPSRACLLTGVYAQQCNMGRSPRGGIKHAVTLAEILKTQGYRTLAVGKHHSTVSLYDRGFDRFYGFHYGAGKSCANHFNPGRQRPGEGVPARKKGETRTYCFDDKKMIPYFTPPEKDWYTTDAFTDWALDFLQQYKDEEKPYFLYVSYTAPHDPLHAWPEDIAKYEGVYEAGYEAIREARFRRQQELGLFKADVRLSRATHEPWDSLSKERKKDQARRMQVYAAMIDRVDQNIGKLLKKIEELGEEDNTLIMFASDNGCSSEDVNTGSGEIGTITRWSSLQQDWANVSNTPFRFWKNLSHEGGICTPFIAHWPDVITEQGGIIRQPMHFIDVMATLCEITGASYPASFNGQPVRPMKGESFLPVFKGDDNLEREKPIFWQYARGGAVRDGRWKLVTQSLSKDAIKEEIDWELYDVSLDLTEMNDVADDHPEVVTRLDGLWRRWYEASYGAPETFSASLIAEGAQLEEISSGYATVEGPLYDGHGHLYFTDIPNEHIWKLNVNDLKTTMFRDNTGGANGLAFDAQGRLLMCKQREKCLARLETDGSETILLKPTRKQGRESELRVGVNDVVVDRKGRIYVTVPGAGSIYRFDADGVNPRVVISGLKGPNGLMLSPDETRLYASEYKVQRLHAWDIDAKTGTATNQRFFAEVKPASDFGCDGMTVDDQGNLYCAGPHAVRVWSPRGKLLETIAIPESPTNCTFAGPGSHTLYITGRKSVYRIRMKTTGVR